MADPLSIAASVAGLLSLAQAVIIGLNNYVMTAKEAPAEIRALVGELESLSTVLHEIETTLVSNPAGQKDNQTLEKTVSVCQEWLKKTLVALQEADVEDEKSKYKRLFKKMKYPFKRDDVQKMLVTVRDYKATLTLAMTLEEKKSTVVIQATLSRLEAANARSAESQQQTMQVLHALVNGVANIKLPSSAETSRVSTKTYFELPMAPANTFVGRDNYLQTIEDHFTSPEFSGQQRRLGIHGLGGSGKTQIAITYAFNHRPSYEAIFFINATSHDSAARDFSKIHQLLKLAEVDGNEAKVEAVKRWFCRTDNRKWLLIFDNADDLEAVDVSSYFPITDCGDILITSRDARIADADLTSYAFHLDVLEKYEAKALLVKRAGIKLPLNEADESTAERIVEELGALPLAIDQAGAYISTRRKKLQDYLKLYQAQQKNLLGYHPKFSKYENTVMTTWEISFQKIESESPEVAQLLLLLSQYDPSNIPDVMLKRGTTKQAHFSLDGELVDLPPEKSFVSRQLIDLLSDDFQFDEAVEKLLSFSLVQRRSNKREEQAFVLHPLVQYCGQTRASEDARRVSLENAVCIASHAYPRGGLDGWDGIFGVEFLPQVEHCCEKLEEAHKLGKKFPQLTDIAPSLFLSAFHFADTRWGERFVIQSELLLQNSENEYLLAFVVERRGKISPALGQKDKGIEVLSEFVRNPRSISGDPTSSDPTKQAPNKLANSMHGCVYTLLAHQLTNLGREDEALDVLRSWKLFEPPSISEKACARYRDRTMSDIYVARKDWAEAEVILRSLLSPDMQDAAEYSGSMGEGWTISQLAQILSETGRHKEASDLIIPAVVARENNGHEAREDNIQIMLDLVSSLLAQGLPDLALLHLMKLRDTLTPTAGLNERTRRDTTNMWCLMARLSVTLGNWMEAKTCWEKALETAGGVNWSDGHIVGAIRFSMAYTLWKLEALDAASDLKYEASTIDLEKGRALSNTGMDKYWIERLLEARKELAAAGVV